MSGVVVRHPAAGTSAIIAHPTESGIAKVVSPVVWFYAPDFDAEQIGKVKCQAPEAGRETPPQTLPPRCFCLIPVGTIALVACACPAGLFLTKYAESGFEAVWFASAFKGTTGPAQTWPPLSYHLKNHLSWLKVMEALPQLAPLRFQGIILTGWQR